MPVRNGARYLGEALASVVGRPEVSEIVVVDDGSSDESVAIASSFPEVRCIRQEPTGVGAARNRGIAETRSSILGFLDADDLWPDFSRTGDPRLAALGSDDRLDAVVGQLQAFRTSADGRRECLGPPWPAMGSFPAGLFRRSLFAHVGPIDETLVIGEDTDWFLRAWEVGARFKWIVEVTVEYRRHTGNTTSTAREIQQGFAGVVARRRARLRGLAEAAVPKRLWPDFEQIAARAHDASREWRASRPGGSRP